MNRPLRRRLHLFRIVVAAAAGYWVAQGLNAESPSFSVAYFHAATGSGGPATISLYSLAGLESKVTLPGLPVSFEVWGFSNDGKAIYGVSKEPPNPSDGVIKIEFSPTRQSRVPGSVGLGGISSLTASPTSSKLFVTGWVWSRGVRDCGAFEIDPDAATLRALRTASSGGCGGANGPVSPTGKLGASYSGKLLSLLDLETGVVQVVKGVSAGDFVDKTWVCNCSWSPDGRWLAAVRDGRIVLIDATNVTRRRNFRASPIGTVHWSPDSKHLAFARSQLSCVAYIDSESLAVTDLDNGHTVSIKSAHCAITRPVIGWLDSSISREN